MVAASDIAFHSLWTLRAGDRRRVWGAQTRFGLQIHRSANANDFVHPTRVGARVRGAVHRERPTRARLSRHRPALPHMAAEPLSLPHLAARCDRLLGPHSCQLLRDLGRLQLDVFRTRLGLRSSGRPHHPERCEAGGGESTRRLYALGHTRPQARATRGLGSARQRPVDRLRLTPGLRLRVQPRARVRAPTSSGCIERRRPSQTRPAHSSRSDS